MDSCENLLEQKTDSLRELHGSLEVLQEEQMVVDEKMCDIDKSFSKKKKTFIEASECDNIIDAISEYILKYFIESIQISELPAHRAESESVSTQSQVVENESLTESHRNISSINISLMSSNKLDETVLRKETSVATEKPDYGPKKSQVSFYVSEEEIKSIEKEVESEDDDDSKNYFINFKSRDKYVLIEFRNGNIYEGKISRHMMEGKGIYTWKDGTQFEGKFTHGVAQGTGYFKWPGRGWYFGEMKDNKRHGKGLCLIQGESQDVCDVCYYGRWKNGQRNGKGILLYGKSNWYDGEWKCDNMHGEGFRLYPTGSYYQGQWKSGQLHGYGTMFWSQGDAYSGMWKKGKMHGKGTYVWRVTKVRDFVFPAQNIYEGSYKSGKKHGFGRLLLASGAIIFAYWRFDKKEGPGKIVCKNGLVLESNNLFFDDRIFDVGEPQDIPEWNKWYYDFLRKYHDGLVLYKPSLEQNKMNDKEAKRKSRTLQAENQKKLCLNNIPLLAGIDTIPLWKFIEMASSLTSVREYQSDVDFHTMLLEEMANEEKLLRQVISNRLPDITFLYNHYSKIAVDVAPNYDCFLLRIMLWQLCQDCKIEKTSYTLHSLDRKIGYGSYPFDVIPMFEMIYYLLYLAFELCMKKGLLNKKINGICGAGFDYFLTKFALPGILKPNIVKMICDSLPLNDLFSFYNSLGKPVTVKTIMEIYFPKCENIDEEETEEKELPLQNISELSVPLSLQGKNCINYDGIISFEYLKDKTPSNENSPQEIDIHTLLSLGEQKVMSCLLKACPRAVNRIFKGKDYEISFLELGQFIINLINEFTTNICDSEAEDVIDNNSNNKNSTKESQVNDKIDEKKYKNSERMGKSKNNMHFKTVPSDIVTDENQKKKSQSMLAP